MVMRAPPGCSSSTTQRGGVGEAAGASAGQGNWMNAGAVGDECGEEFAGGAAGVLSGAAGKDALIRSRACAATSADASGPCAADGLEFASAGSGDAVFTASGAASRA